MSPHVTIGMTVRDAETSLAAAIASVRAQTFEDWALLIVDDGSTDASASIALAAAAEDERIHVTRGSDSWGTAARLNELIDMADGALFARMDADDVAYPQRLARQVSFLESHPEVDLVGASMVVFGAGGQPIGKRAAPGSHEQICRRPASGFRVFHPTWLGRLAWFRRHRYDPTAHRCEDQDLLYRAHRTSVFANVSDPLLGYREDRLDLPNLLVGRVNFARRTARRRWDAGQRPAALATLGEQLAKGSLDAVAVGSGLDHRLLRQRAGPISSAERGEWLAVWSAATRDSRSER